MKTFDIFLFDFCIIIVILDRRLILDVIKKNKIMAEHKKNARPSTWNKHSNRDKHISKQKKN